MLQFSVFGVGSATPQFRAGAYKLPPNMWGIQLTELSEIESHSMFSPGMSSREVVSKVIWPETSGSGVGYALLKNSAGLQSRTMVSHAWDMSFADLNAALGSSGEQGPYWVAATALYQSEDNIRQILSEPLRFIRQVLEHTPSMLCVLATRCNVYERLWCLAEMATAVSMNVEVRVTSKPKGLKAAWSLDDGILKLCSTDVDSRSARSAEQSDEQALRRAIEALEGSYATIDRQVGIARLAALARARDKLLGGGWSTSAIGRKYAEVIDNLAACLKVMPPILGASSSETPAVDGARQTFGASQGASVRVPPPAVRPRYEASLPYETPRAKVRQHWAPTVSM